MKGIEQRIPTATGYILELSSQIWGFVYRVLSNTSAQIKGFCDSLAILLVMKDTKCSNSISEAYPQKSFVHLNWIRLN